MSIARFAAAALLCVMASTGWAQDRVVYHFDDTAVQGLKGLRSLRNHLDVDPNTKIVAVALADGVDMLMEGAKAANGTEFAPLISALVARGMTFEICELTLTARGLKKDQFVLDAGFTTSGVVRIAKLQGQGYAYIKP
jgi:intracellular sulfur oxidation DsrE/DsrF family protein